MLLAVVLFVCHGHTLVFAQVDLRNAPKEIRELIDNEDRAYPAMRYETLWAYFARDSYIAKLKPDEMIRYKAAFDAAKCNAVKRLQTQGFFRTYPFLNRLHRGRVARRSFDRIVAWRVLDYVHCVHRNQVGKLLRFAKQYQIDLIPVDLSPRHSGRKRERSDEYHKFGSSTLQSRVYNSLCAATSWYLVQTIDTGYPEGLRQTLAYYLDSKLIKLSHQQVYYLYALARSGSFVSRKRLLQLEPSHHSVSASDRIRIDRYVAGNGSAARLPAVHPRHCGRERLTAEFWFQPP